MTKAFAFSSRLATVFFGYLAAVAAAGITQAIVFTVFLIVGLPEYSDTLGVADFLIQFLPVFGSLIVWSTIAIAATAVIPSIVGIAFAEYYRFQSLLFYVISGISVALLTASAFFGFLHLNISSGPAPAPKEIFLGIVAYSPPGIVAGVVYWLIAGYSAGNWWRVTTPPTSPAPSES